MIQDDITAEPPTLKQYARPREKLGVESTPYPKGVGTPVLQYFHIQDLHTLNILAGATKLGTVIYHI